MRFRHCAFLLLALSVSRISQASVVVSIDHLEAATPYYDNANAVPFGQTFVAVAANIAGLVVLIGDPNHDPDMTNLNGPASLVLYEADDANGPVQLGSTPFLALGESLTGQRTLLFAEPLPTVIGRKYFVGIDTTDTYGLGLRDLVVSTYDGGRECWLNNGVLVGPDGRDMSFQILSDVSVIRCNGFAPPLETGPVQVLGKRVLPLRALLLDSNGASLTPNDIDAPVVQLWYRPEASAEALDITSQALPPGAATSGNQFVFNGFEWQFNLSTVNLTAHGTYTVSLASSSSTDEVSPTCSVDFIR